MGHGHNYTIEVTVAGIPDPLTGYVIDLKKLSALIDEFIIDKVDHKHLNFDVPELHGIIPTAENLSLVFWQILEPKISNGKLFSIKVFESENNFAQYNGEPVGEIPRYELDGRRGTLARERAAI